MLKKWLMDNPKKFLIRFIILFVGSFLSINLAQSKISAISSIANDEVQISLIKLHSFSSSNNKSGHKYLVAEVLIENLSNKSIKMGSDYSMGLILIDSKGNEYKSGIKGAGIVSEFLTKFSEIQQDQKAYNLSFSDKFPPEAKAKSLLSGFEIPNDAQIVKFGVKKKNLFSEIKLK
jgi:hypothetical protein